MNVLRLIRTIWTAGRGVATGLPDAVLQADPIELFKEWFQAAQKTGILLPEAMMLATATASGKPSSRMVLLKSVDDSGFVFYTNYKSQKAEELDANPFAALLLHWSVLQRQVRIEGSVEKVSREESLAYFNSRHRTSKIGAWASLQSQKLENRDSLAERVKTIESQFQGQEVPLPEFWGGYRIRPKRMEFWQGRAFRLHDRVVFEISDGEWGAFRLYP
jgi:pyridoxamine 5'-phosphate oxidase